MSTATPKKVVKKVAAKKATPAKVAPKKTAAKKTVAPKKAVARKPIEREVGAHGFVVGTDLDTIATALIAGGESRVKIGDALRKKWAKEKTSNGTPKNVAALIASTVFQLKQRGYKIEETFRMVPPTPRKKPVRASK